MDFVTEVMGKVKDSAHQLDDPADFESGIGEALKRYSNDRARILVADIPGAGTHDYPLPAGWNDGFSTVDSVEYPAGQVPECILDPRDYRLYQDPEGLKLRILSTTPGEGTTIRLSFTALHSMVTVPEVDQDAVVNLAASFCLRRLAALFLQTGEPMINADVVNYRSKGDEATRRANDLEKQYKNYLGLKDGDTTPAAMVTAAAPQSMRNTVRRLS
jgi:hypothetical protein